MIAAPSRDWRVVKQSCADHWEALPHAHPRSQTAYCDGLVTKMLGGGNPEKMGDLAYRCRHCGEGKPLVAMSGQASFCLRCAKVYVDHWVTQVRQVLHEGVIYRHIILTVPAMFRTTFSQHAAVVWGACMRCGGQWLADCSSAVRGKPLRGGSIVVLHTHGRHGPYPPISICAPPVEATMGRENAGSLSSLGPMRSCGARGSGIC